MGRLGQAPGWKDGLAQRHAEVRVDLCGDFDGAGISCSRVAANECDQTGIVALSGVDSNQFEDLEPS